MIAERIAHHRSVYEAQIAKLEALPENAGRTKEIKLLRKKLADLSTDPSRDG